MPEGMVGPRTIVVVSKDTVSCSLGNEVAILHMGSGVYYGLDSVGARVWSLLEKPHSVQELCAAVAAEYDVEPSRCEADLLALLVRMRTEGLIEIRTV
jgi:hypothetical protein